jgi:hypothetical protein
MLSPAQKKVVWRKNYCKGAVCMINKIDYFCGAFLSFLITNGITPALIETGEKSKIVKFGTDLDDYKVYIKYSTTCKTNDKKNIRKWDITFTNKEMDILQEFLEQKRKHFFVLVCADSRMRETEIAVLDLHDGLKCLGNDPVNKKRRISVIHKKGSPYIKCYGTARDEEEGVRIYKDYQRYFMNKEINYV